MDRQRESRTTLWTGRPQDHLKIGKDENNVQLPLWGYERLGEKALRGKERVTIPVARQYI